MGHNPYFIDHVRYPVAHIRSLKKLDKIFSFWTKLNLCQQCQEFEFEFEHQRQRKRSFIWGIILLYVDYNLNHVSNRRPAGQMWSTKSFFITQQCTIFVTSINNNQFHKHLLIRKFDPPGLNYNVQRWMTKTSTSKSAYVLSGGESSLTFLSWTLGSFSVLISLVTVLAVEVEPLSE